MPALLSRRIHERHEHDPSPDVNDNAGIGAAQGFNPVAIDRAASTLFVDVPMGLRGLQILVIEDASDVLGVLTMLLRIEGADVAAAGSGQEALAIFRSRHFDVVVSDLGLPDISGDVLIRTIIEAARRPIKIVVITFGQARRAALSRNSPCSSATASFRRPAGTSTFPSHVSSRARISSSPWRCGRRPASFLEVLDGVVDVLARLVGRRDLVAARAPHGAAVGSGRGEEDGRAGHSR